MSDSGLVGTLLRSWQLMYVVAVPLLLLPLPFYMQNKAGLSAYAMLWMAFYWTAEPIPLPVTALMPLVLFPLFGVLTTAETTKMYFNNIGFVMFGSLVVAAAVEVSNFASALGNRDTSDRRHQQPQAPIWFHAGHDVLVDVDPEHSVCLHYGSHCRGCIRSGTGPDQGGRRAENELHVFQMRKVMLLSVAYAANIGGTGSVIGTPPNLILQALYIKQFNQDDLTFLAWMLYNVPPMLVCTSLAWLYTQWIVAKLTQFNQDDLTFLAWMLYNVPPMLVCTSLAWLYTQWIVAKLTRVPTTVVRAGGVHVEYSEFVAVVSSQGFRPREASATVVVSGHVSRKRAHVQGVSPNFWNPPKGTERESREKIKLELERRYSSLGPMK
ncbi:hypothetical protein HPB51_023147 [Rhipicephalus microplus]|uniref:Citrate transporter-like domain-containing protein n=1 Tax=Rhipicephalus microplus TaxID=6941 RepID=A0A9J6DWU8_RHIMP|nr:hypothetical protein HPB51_023147 [Rhipicephalus microplus]